MCSFISHAGYFQAWLLLAMSLRWPLPVVADYGLALTLLAPVYVAIGLYAQRWRPSYRWPWYLAGFALSAIGPLLTISDPTYRLLALTISIGLYAACAVIWRQSGWLYLVAVLMPVLVLQATEHLGVHARFDGPVLVILALVFGGVGVVLHHGVADPRQLRGPVRGPIGEYARPFFVVGYLLCALGLALVASQDRALVVVAFLIAAVLFGGSAWVFRQPLFGYPLVATACVAYVAAMTLTPLDAQYYGLALMPGVLAALTAAEVARRRLDTMAATAARAPSVFERWAMPYYAVVYLGTLAVPAWSTAEQGIWVAAWWAVALVYGVSVVLFRHPAWLYPTLGTAVVAYAATLFAVAAGVSTTDALAALAIPGVLLFGGALAVAYRDGVADWPSLERLRQDGGW